jgi:hypothetical protein
MSDITVIATCYGDYWDTFHEQWEQSIAGLDPAPAEIILVSDIERPVPEGVRNIAIGPAHMTDYWMVGALAASTEWVSLSGFDDVWMPDAMTPFETDADVYGFPVIMTGLMSGVFAYGGGYESILEVGHNPMLGDFFYRRSLLEEIPLRRMGYMDWAHFSEMRYFGRTFDAGGPPRAYKTRHPQAISLVNRPDFQHEIDDFKARLRAGLIQMGVAL